MTAPLRSRQLPPPPGVADAGRGRGAPRGTAGRRMVGLCAAFLACGCADGSDVAVADRDRMVHGERTLDSLLALARADEPIPGSPALGRDTVPPGLDVGGAVALVYLERLRLGLGSPFQLAESVQHDARVPAGVRRSVAWAILARTARGELNQLDSTALGERPDPWRPGATVDGGRHRTLIDSVIAAAPDARTGEATLRLAYALAEAERLVDGRVSRVVVHAAALARDRRLAAADARRLLDAAERRTPDAPDALALLARWRQERRFLVERPLLGDDLRPDEQRAATDAERLLAEFRAAARRPVVRPVDGSAQDGATIGLPSDSQVVAGTHGLGSDREGGLDAGAAAARLALPVTPPASGCEDARSFLPCRTAARLAAAPAVLVVRPEAQVAVTLGSFRSMPVPDVRQRSDTNGETVVRTRMLTRVRTQEALAAEWALAGRRLDPGSPIRRQLAELVHATAVAARPFAQARVALPGDSLADVEQVADALRIGAGLRGVAFERGMPAGWRVPALRDLEEALAELRLALPGVALDGLQVRIGGSPKGDLALALHDPGSRTVFLPPASSAGTVAHELAHDLDWQAARSQFAVRGAYATDRAARDGRGELAAAVRGLAPVQPRQRQARERPASERPAELFARGVDWYVAAILARSGRMNGMLSSVQEGEIPGYAGATAPLPGDGTAESLVAALGGVTRLSPTSARWYLGRFGSEAARPAQALVAAVVEATPNWRAERTLRGLGVPDGLAAFAPPVVPRSAAVASCALPGWQQRLLWVAADARARGMLRSQASRAALAGGGSWQSRASIGLAWSPEAAEQPLRRLRDAVLRAAGQRLGAGSPFAELDGCA